MSGRATWDRCDLPVGPTDIMRTTDITREGDEDFVHRPVMVDEVVALFEPVPPGLLVDATVGGGGHAAALLASRQDVDLLGIDRDPSALAAAELALAPYGDRITLRHRRFDHLADTLAGSGRNDVTGVLFDLGVSSPQLDHADRGFSYRSDAPLDMRMDQQRGLTAHVVVNDYEEERLARVLHDYGDERYARRIAAAVVQARPIDTTAQLAEVVVAAIPAPARRRGGHPAKRTFQAIRIEVNEELEVLPGALDQAIEALIPSGRCAVLAYHSGEDRIVKERFRTAETGGCTCPSGLPCVCGATPTVKALGRRARRPSDVELQQNRRATSARLRAVERIGPR